MKTPILVALLGCIFLAACGHETHEKEESFQFITTNPLVQDTIVLKEYVGQVRAIQHIELRALERGYIQDIFVDEGSKVKKGQVMFQIMPAIQEAEFQRANAELEYAEIEYQNTLKLFESKVVSASELALTKAKLNKAKAEQTLASAHLNFTKVKAPFDGIMDHFNVRVGSLVEEGELLTALSDNSEIWVYFNVPEVEYLNFMMNQAEEVDAPVNLILANNLLYPERGKIQTIEADFNNETGNIDFRAIFPNPKRLLRHGETGKIQMEVPYKNAIIIPQKATMEILEKHYVFILSKDNKIIQREIEIAGEMSNLYIVKKGLQANDRLLLEGIRKVTRGQKIKATHISAQKAIDGLQVYVE